MWRFLVDEAGHDNPSPDNQNTNQNNGNGGDNGNGNGGPGGAPPALALSQPSGDTTAASDGQRFLVFDHLVGRIQGEAQQLGNVPLGARQSRPVAGPDGFIALGMLDGQRVVLVALDRLGERRWRSESPPMDRILAISGPALLDDLVTCAVLCADGDNCDLHVLAFSARTGASAWDTQVARLPVGRNIRMMNEGIIPVPAVCVQGGSLLVLSNSGLIARLGGDGTVRRVWSYPGGGAGDDLAVDLPGLPSTLRQGAIASDGVTAVATPADNGALAVVLHGDDQPRFYRGDGANGEVLAVANGAALLAGRVITLLDLAALTPRWTNDPGQRLSDPEGSLGTTRALVAGKQFTTLLDAANGSVVGADGDSGETLGRRSFPIPNSIALADGQLLIGATDKVVAYGTYASTYDRLAAAAAAHPADYRPEASLGSLLMAKGDNDRALAAWQAALARGAPPEYAEKAARLVRSRLDLALGDNQSFAAALAGFAALAPYAAELGTEAAYWKARQAEAAGRHDRDAETGYRQVLAAPERLIAIHPPLEVSLHQLARAGLQRLAGTPAGPGGPPVPADPLPTILKPWLHPDHRAPGTVVAGGLAIGYADGVLSAVKVSDGSDAWVRRPQRNLLGVKTLPIRDPNRGVVIEPVTGSSAAAAGVLPNDVLIEFDGKPIHDFASDLVPLVMAAPPRAPFTMKLLRGAETVTCTGLLGGDMVAPIAANARTVLVWPTMPRRPREGGWVSALDLATGAELFPAHALPLTTTEHEAIPPLLTADDTIILADGPDLVALAAHAAGALPAGGERWRIHGEASELDQVHLLDGGLLWLPDRLHHEGRLLSTADGQVVARLPAAGDKVPVVSGWDCCARMGDGTLVCWDLGSGRERWRGPVNVQAVLAIDGDDIVVVGDDWRLGLVDRLSGKPRRTIGSWTSLQPDWLIGADRIFVHARAQAGGDVVAAVARAGGAVLWEQPLPARCDLQRLVPGPDGGVCAVLRAGDQAAVVAFSNQGKVAQAWAVGTARDAWLPLPGGLLDLGADGLSALPATAVPPRAPLPAQPLPLMPEDLAAAVPALAAHAAWQTCGPDAAYALARGRAGVVVLARTTTTLTVHLADAGPALDQGGLAVVFAAADGGGVRLQPGDTSGWRLAGIAVMPAGADGSAPVLAAALAPPPERIAPLPLAARGDSGGASDCPGTPPWLLQAWRPVVTAP
jgi:outer membrane protein assembly factor BamB